MREELDHSGHRCRLARRTRCRLAAIVALVVSLAAAAGVPARQRPRRCAAIALGGKMRLGTGGIFKPGLHGCGKRVTLPIPRRILVSNPHERIANWPNPTTTSQNARKNSPRRRKKKKNACANSPPAKSRLKRMRRTPPTPPPTKASPSRRPSPNWAALPPGIIGA